MSDDATKLAVARAHLSYIAQRLVERFGPIGLLAHLLKMRSHSYAPVVFVPIVTLPFGTAAPKFVPEGNTIGGAKGQAGGKGANDTPIQPAYCPQWH
jgi:hypothetical protein